MDVSVIIVNYNTIHYIKDCIRSIKECTNGIDYEIIVVDNASPNDDVNSFHNEFPEITLIRSIENLGFGRANNLGAQNAKGRNLFFLNPDTKLISNAIKILSDFLENHSDIGACGGNLYDKDNLPTLSFSRLMPSLKSDLDYLFLNIYSKLKYGKLYYFNKSDRPINIKGNISGADLMMRRNLFIKLEGFDKDYFMYYEETDLIFRLRKLGYKTFIIPNAKIIHYEGKSETVKENTLNRLFVSKRIYYLKNKTKKSFEMSNRIQKWAIGNRLNIYKILGKNKKVELFESLYKNLTKNINNIESQ